jgi:hypothetical protein
MGLRIEIPVNGETREIHAGLNVRQMHTPLSLVPRRIAAGRDRAIAGKA